MIGGDGTKLKIRVRRGTEWEKVFQERGKKFVYDACQKSTVFWPRIFLQELQSGYKDVGRFTFLGNCDY